MMVYHGLEFQKALQQNTKQEIRLCKSWKCELTIVRLRNYNPEVDVVWSYAQHGVVNNVSYPPFMYYNTEHVKEIY